jgi:hypothetical protein
VIVNTFKSAKRQQAAYTVGTTNLVKGSINPVFRHTLRLASVGGGLVVLSVISKHSSGGDVLLGQVNTW